MGYAGKHGTETKRQYSHQEGAQRLVSWLNASSEDQSRKRIKTLLRLVEDIQSCWVLSPEGTHVQFTGQKNAKKYKKLQDQIFKSFSSYRFFLWPEMKGRDLAFRW